MLSGSLNSENLSQTLRDISQRRRQGALRVEFGTQKVEILVVQGRIVDVVEVDQNPLAELFAVLKRVAIVPEDFELSPELLTYGQLYQRLNQELGGLDKELYKEVLRHQILDKLYKLEARSGGFYIFQMKMIEVEREFCPSISVGQLLLDLVALKNDANRFNQLFNKKVQIQPNQGAGDSFSTEEQQLWDIIGEGVSYSSLRERSYLSSFHLQDVLLSFVSKDLVSLGVAAQESDLKDSVSLADQFDRSIDASFAANPVSNASPQSALMQGEELLEETIIIPRQNLIQALRGKFNLLNFQLLHADWIPTVLSMVFLFAAIAAPLVLWGKVIQEF